MRIRPDLSISEEETLLRCQKPPSPLPASTKPSAARIEASGHPSPWCSLRTPSPSQLSLPSCPPLRDRALRTHPPPAPICLETEWRGDLQAISARSQSGEARELVKWCPHAPQKGTGSGERSGHLCQALMLHLRPHLRLCPDLYCLGPTPNSVMFPGVSTCYGESPLWLPWNNILKGGLISWLWASQVAQW